MTERDAESLLPMLSTEVEHVVRFTPAWRGYARSEVDAFVTRSERELGALRGRVEDLDAALRDAESHRGETAAEAARWKAMYEDSVPPFEELGTRVAEILGLAEAEARERVRAAEDEASTLVAEAGVRAASMVTQAEQRASARETEAEQRASARETEAEERAGLLVADAERRAAELEAAAEERSAARAAAATERVDSLEREHAALVERLGGIRDVLSRLPGLGGVAAVADETPGDEVPPDVTPADDVVAAAADETPADETPADETPADETPADETPADEVVAVDPDAT
ncbi:MAG TPA: DivIVA domain-containing protein, partial [Jiangellales bacterium]|nr:DivIVA domain-containing protein [Jiangellales bacterium]